MIEPVDAGAVNQPSSSPDILSTAWIFATSFPSSEGEARMSVCRYRLSVCRREDGTFLSDGAPDGDDEHTDDSEDQQSQDAPDHCIRNGTVSFHHCPGV